MHFCRITITSILLVGWTAISAFVPAAFCQSPQRIRFDQDVRPILSNHCWSCHGPDESGRQARLRLDLSDTAQQPAESGVIAIVPGDPEQSELIRRIEADEADVRMPPPDAKNPLTTAQQQVLRQWIAEGAGYTTHWAFRSPTLPKLPAVQLAGWTRNEIDTFVLQALEQRQLQPSTEAEPSVWLRRVTLDLTGFPPSLAELDAFESRLTFEPQEVVYGDTVDRLLNSPRYAERMAMHWLDLARYADTNGYNNDEIRTMWPWRDWVISAFASGMPYNQFLTEQLAGDLLPNATLSQKVATGFNRNHVLTTEGGIIEEEYHVEYVADRLHTTATVFMAMSMQCARCHDHKYDPISQREYYQFASFFNNVPDRVVSYNQARMAEPLLQVPSPEQQSELDRIDARIAEIDQLLTARSEQVGADIAAWEMSLTPQQIAEAGPAGLVAHFALDEAAGDVVADQVVRDRSAKISGTARHVVGRSGMALSFDGNSYVDAGQVGDFDAADAFTTAAWVQLASNDASTVLSKMDESAAYRGYDVIMEGGKVAAHFVHIWPGQAFKVVSKNSISRDEWHHVAVTYDGSRRAEGVKLYVDGVAQEFHKTTDNELTGTLKTEKPFHIGRRQNTATFKGLIDDVQLYSAALSPEDVAALANGQFPGQLAKILAVPLPERSNSQQQLLKRYFLEQIDKVTRELRSERAGLPHRRAEIEKEIPATMVMSEPETPRPAFVLKRGQYDQRGEPVESALPAALSGEISTDLKTKLSRLDLARWLTDPRHPLTTRVAVNRWWEMLFGTGLVETAEDFGIQGEFPSHPELLDWLATELVRQNWDPRAVLKQIVMSATYRQRSDVTPELLDRDPRNRWLTRGPRFRLSAETVRDSALFVSGLMCEHIGGSSVKPYQPEGLWEDVSVERREKYVPDQGEGLYRRSMYTFWKRTCPPPGMSTFDAPDREFCLIRRTRTNTPLQALVLLNDPTYTEAARRLAERTMLFGPDSNNRIDFAFRTVLARSPEQTERAALLNVVAAARQHFESSPDAATELLSVGSSPRNQQLPPDQLAAWTTAMSVLLNLDEAISRP